LSGLGNLRDNVANRQSDLGLPGFPEEPELTASTKLQVQQFVRASRQQDLTPHTGSGVTNQLFNLGFKALLMSSVFVKQFSCHGAFRKSRWGFVITILISVSEEVQPWTMIVIY
jgi:hypothetical protein